MRHALLLTGLMLIAPSVVRAQELLLSGAVQGGSGVQVGTATGNDSVVLRTPAFVDLALRTWSDEQPTWILGGSLRLEFEGGASVAAVPRAEFLRTIGLLSIRPGVGIPLFFAPFSMLGVEAGVSVHVPLVSGLGAIGMVAADAFFFGSDLPARSVVLMFNGMLGAELFL